MKELTGDKWDLGDLKGITTEYLWVWANKGGIGYDGHAYLGIDKCIDFERDLFQPQMGQLT